jgi:phage terminase small subunit
MKIAFKPPEQPPLDPGATLSQAALELKARLLAEYQVDDAAGLAVLQTALEAFDAMREAQAVVAEHGPCFKDRYGQLRVNPATVIVRDSRAQFLRALKDLNFDLEPLKPGGRPPAIPLRVK